MGAVTIYHNPRCSKSRATLALLEERGIEPEVIRYLDTPPDPATLRRLADMLGVAPRGLLRSKEAAYSEQGLDDPDVPDARVLEIIAAHPILLERPIVVHGDRAAVGRPPEQVLEIL